MRVKRATRSRSVDVVPLIDTVFLLLVIFLMMVLRMRADDGLEVELPPVGRSVATATDDAPIVVIGVTRGGAIAVDGETCALADVARAVGADVSRVEIRGDRRAPHGVVMAVLNTVQTAGIRDIRFGVSPGQEGGTR